MMQKANFIIVLCVTLMILTVLSASIQAQNLNNVKLFQSYFYDAPITKVTYGEGGLEYQSYDGFSMTRIGIQDGFSLTRKFEIDTDIDYVSFSPDNGDGESGLSDLAVYGRYLMNSDKMNTFSVGGMLTLPIGSEDIGQGNVDLGAFGALRHKLGNSTTLSASAALIFDQYRTGSDKDRETYFRLGAGVIFPMSSRTAIVCELVTQTKWDYSMLSGGLDHKIANGTLRGALGFGLDDGAPDLSIFAKYAITLK